MKTGYLILLSDIRQIIAYRYTFPFPENPLSTFLLPFNCLTLDLVDYYKYQLK